MYNLAFSIEGKRVPSSRNCNYQPVLQNTYWSSLMKTQWSCLIQRVSTLTSNLSVTLQTPMMLMLLLVPLLLLLYVWKHRLEFQVTSRELTFSPTFDQITALVFSWLQVY